ncbi:hypothetical protein PPN31114_03752 [Pandoraea pneumonica]|jgi:hypothetical protein|uniref:Uncharacterized protein n=1 Tax=Pandoraea pneumonica TaxID=2508299 RepID=A0A5E4X973_9BURK|nr:hypothetical protein [Pandoraea pneumonica]VVE32836.1 hypothetical protein PPN31114_03752 [Pandoraea pneumonica]
MDERDGFDAVMDAPEADAEGASGDSVLLLGEFGNDFDEEEWTW